MNTEKFDLLILRGAPGSGKSSLGRRVKKVFPNGFLVEVDDVRGMINSVKWVNTEEHLNALNSTESLVKSYLNAGYKPAIVVDTFSPSKLKFFIEKFSDYAYIVVSLYANDNILKIRLANREKGFKDWEMAKVLNAEVGKFRHTKEILIDTSALNKEQVLEKAIQEISKADNV